MGAFAGQIDAERWPLVVLKLKAYATRQSLDELVDGIDNLIRRREKFCILGDFTGKGCMELPEVRRLTDLLVRQGRRLDRRVLACALAVPSPMVRGAFRLVFENCPPKYPWKFFHARHEAKHFLDKYLDELAAVPVARRVARTSTLYVAAGPL